MHDSWQTMQWLAQAIAVHGPLRWDEARGAVVAGDVAGDGTAADAGAGDPPHGGVALRLRDVTLLHRRRRARLQGGSGSDVLELTGGSQPRSVVEAAPRRIDVEPADGLWVAELIGGTVDLFHGLGAVPIAVGPDLSLRADADVAGVAARLEMVLDDGHTGPAWSITLPAPAGRLPPLRMGHWVAGDGEVKAVLPIEERSEGMGQVGAFFTGVARLVAVAG